MSRLLYAMTRMLSVLKSASAWRTITKMSMCADQVSLNQQIAIIIWHLCYGGISQ